MRVVNDKVTCVGLGYVQVYLHKVHNNISGVIPLDKHAHTG